MIVTVLRSVGAVAAGIVVAMILIVAVEMLSAIVHPFPDGFKGTPEEMRQHVVRYPQWVLAAAVVAWGATAFAGTWTAGRLGNRGCALFVGLLLLAAVILNISMLPYPVWFKIASVVGTGVGVVGGYWLSGRRGNSAVKVAE